MKTFLLVSIFAANLYFIMVLIKDNIRNFDSLKKEKGSFFFYVPLAIFSMFLSTFGISDFAINSFVYNQANVFPKRLIPGTLNTEGTIPLFAMSLIYINLVECDALTLVLLVMSQVLGSLVSPSKSMASSDQRLRNYMGIGLLIAAVLMLFNSLGIIPMNGEETGLRGMKLIVGIVLLFLFGALNNYGIGSFAPTMATIYILGMNPLVAFPIMMTACSLSFVVGSVQFVKKAHYSRKATIFFSVFGTLGVIFAGTIVKEMDISVIRYVTMIVLCVGAFSLLVGKRETVRE